MTVADPPPTLRIRGARTHNLCGIDVDLPLGRFNVITGVSGSGKTSLAFQTIFTEGQRRFLECIAPHASRWREQLARPDVDEIEGLGPCVSLTQQAGPVRLRTDVGAITEIGHYLRLLFARAGTPRCPTCGTVIRRQSPQAIVDDLLTLGEGVKAMLLAPVARRAAEDSAALLQQAARAGFVRVRIDGTVHDLSSAPRLDPQRLSTVEVVVDRVVIRREARSRLDESVQLALKQGDGACVASWQAGEAWHDRRYTSVWACPACGERLPEVEPRSFHPGSPAGACPACAQSDTGAESAEACAVCGGSRLGVVARNVFLGGRTIVDWNRAPAAELTGYVEELGRLFMERDAAGAEAGPAEDGAGLREAARAIVERIVPELKGRIARMMDLGLDYLTLDRPSATLSVGERQRARLVKTLGAGLVGACYILDEPTCGLHPRDTARLVEALRALRDQGNTLIVVEHDMEVVRQADWIVDLGPGAGVDGGRLLAAGPPDEVARCASPTGQALSRPVEEPFARRPLAASPGRLVLRQVRCRNLKGVDVEFPLGRLIAVTGVSGSGKTSLVFEALRPLLQCGLGRTVPESDLVDDGRGITLSGVQRVAACVVLEQSAWARSAVSCPATFTGAWDLIRKLLARTPAARVAGFDASRFSPTSRDGRCGVCRGRGVRPAAVEGLEELVLTCPACQGDRFNAATLGVRYHGRNAAQLLALRFDEAAELFAGVDRLRRICQAAVDCGLGYIVLGQPAWTLSGGEAQRLRIARALARPAAVDQAPATSTPVGTPRRGTVYLLDEPTAGQHPSDVARLVELLDCLVAQGDTVIAVEHNLDLISACDHVIDLGPGSGSQGGRIVAAGSPDEIAACAASFTGAALRARR